jgi:hypothetical protein
MARFTASTETTLRKPIAGSPVFGTGKPERENIAVTE